MSNLAFICPQCLIEFEREAKNYNQVCCSLHCARLYDRKKKMQKLLGETSPGGV